MNNATHGAAESFLSDHNHLGASIPDPTEWVDEHHFLAGFVHTLNNLHNLLPDSFFSDSSACEEADESLRIDAIAREFLKATYSDNHWAYLENYLLVEG